MTVGDVRILRVDSFARYGTNAPVRKAATKILAIRSVSGRLRGGRIGAQVSPQLMLPGEPQLPLAFAAGRHSFPCPPNTGDKLRSGARHQSPRGHSLNAERAAYHAPLDYHPRFVSLIALLGNPTSLTDVSLLGYLRIAHEIRRT
jgi:hypothetical protein